MPTVYNSPRVLRNGHFFHPRHAMLNTTFDPANLDWQFWAFCVCLVCGYVYSQAVNRARAAAKAKAEAEASGGTHTTGAVSDKKSD